MVMGKIGEQKKLIKTSDYRYLTCMHTLCGRGLYQPNMSSREEVRSRMTSAIERKFRFINELEPTKDGWQRLVNQCVSDVCLTLHDVDDMQTMTFDEYFNCNFRHTPHGSGSRMIKSMGSERLRGVVPKDFLLNYVISERPRRSQRQ